MATLDNKDDIINHSNRMSYVSGRRSSYEAKSPRNVKGMGPLISIEMIDSEDSRLNMALDPLD